MLVNGRARWDGDWIDSTKYEVCLVKYLKKEISFSFSISTFTLFHKFAKFNLFFPSLVMVSLLL